ncbi:FACT complex subunit Ssrp1-like, partial [Camellia sinensis]|uniref:FACT complex subunit Ssrp1-like n=1 Tax=Camellia sinensis TaxID=4442 RepID=UPI001035D101
MNEDLLNSKYKDKLEPSYKGLIHEVFILIMRGLSGAKVTRPGKFRSCQDGYAVKFSLKAEDGVLYPLEKGFFFLPKPPTLILHEEIDYVEFERHAAGGCYKLLMVCYGELEVTAKCSDNLIGMVFNNNELSGKIPSTKRTTADFGDIKMEMNKIRDELNEKISEVRRLQIELTRRENAETNDIADGLKRVIATLEKENNNLK